MANRTKKIRGMSSLGRRVTTFKRLDTFDAPKGTNVVTLVCDEVTAVCPVTQQPDYYKVTIIYYPQEAEKPLCVESKAVKLFLQQFRNEGIFCEQFADKIAFDFSQVLKCGVQCEVEQKSRGGISIISKSYYSYVQA